MEGGGRGEGEVGGEEGGHRRVKKAVQKASMSQRIIITFFQTVFGVQSSEQFILLNKFQFCCRKKKKKKKTDQECWDFHSRDPKKI